MELAVTTFIQSFGETDPEIKLKSDEVLHHLNSVAQERQGVIKSYEALGKALPKTNVYAVDSIMTYMLNKAKQAAVALDLTVSGSIKFMAEHIISESHLTTLLSDLIENAIIATKASDSRHVLVNLGITSGFYFIEVADSGHPFSLEVLTNLGLKKITTHKKDGGSGIGLTTAFEILKEYNASLIIEETTLENAQFTKKLCIRFDNLGKYEVHTPRADVLTAVSQRDDLTIVQL